MKRKGLKSLLLVFVLSTLAIALSGCSGDKEGENSSQITIGIPQDLEDSLDPHKMVAAGTKEVLFNLFEGLVKPTSDGDFIPAVASKYEESEDGKVYTFTLRDGVKFHDGTLVTAEDVKFSLDKCADASKGEPLVAAYSNIESIEIADEKTIVITLKEPNTEFLAYMTTAIIPASNTEPDTNPIGTGPYKFVSRSPQENFVVERFDEYWGEPAGIEHVTFKVCANANSIVMDLEGGSIDMFARVTASQAAELSDQFQVLEGTMNLVQALYLNNAQKPFDDVRVRQALCYAIDPEEIMMMVSDGKGTELGSSMFPAFSKYFVEELNHTYDQDVEKAKELLKEAGYPDGEGFPAITYKYPSLQLDSDMAQALQAQWKTNLGIEVELQAEEQQVQVAERRSGDFQLARMRWTADFTDPFTFLSMYRSNDSYNDNKTNCPEYDELMAQSNEESDPTARFELLHQAESVLVNDYCFGVPVLNSSNIYLVSTDITNFEIDPSRNMIRTKYLVLGDSSSES